MFSRLIPNWEGNTRKFIIKAMAIIAILGLALIYPIPIVANSLIEHTDNQRLSQAGLGSISGRVYDATAPTQNTPLADARVMVWTTQIARLVKETTCAADGSYTLTDIPFGNYKVMAVKIGYAQKYWGGSLSVLDATPITVNSSAGVGSIDISLSAGGYIGGIITDAGSGKPIQGITVYITYSDGTPALPLWTDNSGAYFTVVPLGAYKVYAPTDLVPDQPQYHRKYYDGQDGTVDPTQSLVINIINSDGQNNINLSLNAIGAISSATAVPIPSSTPAVVPTPYHHSSVAPVISLLRPDDFKLENGAKSFGLALATILVFYFAATLFNSTIKEREEVINGWIRQSAARLRLNAILRDKHRITPKTPKSKLRYSLEVLAVILICSMIYWFLRPYFNEALQGITLLISLIIGISVVTLAYDGTQVYLSTRVFQTPAAIRIYIMAIPVAIICVIFSHVIGFHPGLIYGFVGSYALLGSKELTARRKGATILFSTLLLVLISVIVYLLWAWLNYQENDGTLRFAISNILAAIFAIGLEGLVFAFIPLKFLDGAKLREWNFWIWLGIAIIVTTAFYFIIVSNPGEKLTNAVGDMEYIVMEILMGISLVISIGTWIFFWLYSRSTETKGIEKS